MLRSLHDRTAVVAVALCAAFTCVTAAHADLGDQLFKLLPDDGAANDQFGISVDISGATAIVGAWQDDDNGKGSGSAYLFNTTTGLQIGAKLLPDDGAAGDLFGVSVAISGDAGRQVAIIGAYRDDDNGTDSGSAYLIDITTGLQFKLVPDDGAEGDDFGYSVAISGTTAIVGARRADDDSGSAYLFDTTTGLQIGAKLLPDVDPEDDWFGISVAISGDIAIVGASMDDDNGISSGSAYLFDAATGQQIGAKLLPGDGAVGHQFGVSVAISGATAIVGARQHDASADNSGAAYLFDAASVEHLIIFREKNDSSWECFGLGADCIPGWDHVGFGNDGIVFESHPGYVAGEYWDPDDRAFVDVAQVDGVQDEHTVGSFRHDSMTQDTEAVSVSFPAPASGGEIEAMVDFIFTQFDHTFLFLCGAFFDLSCWVDTLSPDRQKAIIGDEYTCVGLVERAAEEAGINFGQGFIPDEEETFSVPAFGEVPNLSPWLMAVALERGGAAPAGEAGLLPLSLMTLGEVDVIITDPMGRRIGHTEELGDINEIPEAFYTGSGGLERVMIFNPLLGEYTLELFGLGEELSAAIGGASEGDLFQGFIDMGETVIIEVEVVEPCLWDLDDDGNVGTGDLIVLLGAWGKNPGHPADFDGDGNVGAGDLIELLGAWGPCP